MIIEIEFRIISEKLNKKYLKIQINNVSIIYNNNTFQ